jgi:hypothetical protein
MKKLIALFSVGILVAMMVGCGLNPAGPATLNVTISAIPDLTAGSGGAQISVTIESDSAITNMTYAVMSGTNDRTSDFNITPPLYSDYQGKESVTINFTISAKSGITGGTYSFKVTVDAGDLTKDDARNFTVAGGTGGTLSSASLTLGAQNAAPPSLLDADNMTRFSNTSTPTGVQQNIDAIFSFSTVLSPNALAFTAPDSAQGSPYTGWTYRPVTKFKKVTATWANITTQSDVNALWSGVGGSGVSRIAVAQGDVIVISTSAGTYKVVQIAAVNGTDSYATIDINGKY